MADLYEMAVKDSKEGPRLVWRQKPEQQQAIETLLLLPSVACISSIDLQQERIKDSTAVPSIGTTGESARAGGVSRLRSAGDSEAPAKAECFGVFTGSGTE